MSDIGLLNETPLHASLKQWYAQPGDRFEVAVDGFVIDLVRGELLLEIQTGSFSHIKSKLRALVQEHTVRLIYPVARETWIVKPAAGGESRRKSPKRGRVEDLFWEMVSFPDLLAHPNFELEVLMTQQDELRRYVGRRRRRRKGWSVEQRRLVGVVGQMRFGSPSDWLELLPSDLIEPFGTKDLAAKTGVGRTLAQKMAYCLRKAGAIEQVGKRGREPVYERA